MEKIATRKSVINVQNNNSDRMKRCLTIVDDSLASIDITLWGQYAGYYISENEDASSIVDS